MAMTFEEASGSFASRSSSLMAFVRKNGSIFLIYGLIILIAGAAAIYSDTFRTPSNMANILRQSIILGPSRL